MAALIRALQFDSGPKTEGKSINSTMSGSFCGSLMIPVTLCIVMFAERQAQILLAKLNLLPKFCMQVLFFAHGGQIASVKSM
jgi:hypothetical protein